MSHWKGIVGRGFSATEFARYVASLKFGPWRPRFVVLHNTATPTLARWHDHPGAERMRNLADYYRGLGWSAGPHLFVADDLIWVFSPLDAPGVHSPSWNRSSWGVEIVGDFDIEPFEGAIRENAIEALAALHLAAHLDSHTLRLHREDPETTHACPGRNIDKADVIRRLHNRIAASKG